MRKFKHKTTGNIAVETHSEKNYKVSQPQNFTVPKWIVENSNDWEEVIELDYEILQQPWHNIITKKPGPIISIMRKSDNEIFRIGDNVRYNRSKNCTIWEIDNFLLKNNIMLARSSMSSGANVEDIKTLDIVKKPLFTTEDEVDVFEGTNFWCVDKSFCLKYWDCRIMESLSSNYTFLENKPKFSTKELAEAYIKENKPKYSKKNMIDFAEYCNVTIIPRNHFDAIKEGLFDKWKSKVINND